MLSLPDVRIFSSLLLKQAEFNLLVWDCRQRLSYLIQRISYNLNLPSLVPHMNIFSSLLWKFKVFMVFKRLFFWFSIYILFIVFILVRSQSITTLLTQPETMYWFELDTLRHLSQSWCSSSVYTHLFSCQIFIYLSNEQLAKVCYYSLLKNSL